MTKTSTVGGMILAGALLAAAGLRAEAGVLGLPGSTWGEASRDTEHYEGWSTQGNVQQGLDWLKLPKEHLFDTYVKGSWRFRDQHPLYYDAWSPGAGAEIRGSFYRLGVEYAHTRYPELGEELDTAWAQLVWYLDWTLGRRYPGAAWGQVTHSFDGYEGTGSQGYVNQGVRLAALPGGVAMSAFGEYRWRVRALNNTYYDTHGPAVGLDFRRDFLRAGFEHYWEFLPGLARWDQRNVFFVSWYLNWDLKPKTSRP